MYLIMVDNEVHSRHKTRSAQKAESERLFARGISHELLSAEKSRAAGSYPVPCGRSLKSDDAALRHAIFCERCQAKQGG